MPAESAQLWIRSLVGLSILIQGFELFALHSKESATSPWHWNNIKGDFKHLPNSIKSFLDKIFLQYFKLILILQIISAIFLPFINSNIPTLILFVLHFLILMRFRGCFNGGSDYMTTTVLLGLVLNMTPFPKPFYSKIGFYYIAVQCTLSYFIAGIVKVKNSDWRSGRALKNFLSFTNYNIPISLQNIFVSGKIINFISWIVILLECLFPIVWFNKALTPFFLTLFFTFHLINFIFFGLNIFVFAWLSSYPALVYCIFSN